MVLLHLPLEGTVGDLNLPVVQFTQPGKSGGAIHERRSRRSGVILRNITNIAILPPPRPTDLRQPGFRRMNHDRVSMVPTPAYTLQRGRSMGICR